MGPKKKNEISNKKQGIIKAWPNLPQNLLNLITRQPDLFENITSFGCITKSWRRSTSKKCSRQPQWPQLVEINSGGGGDDHQYHKLAMEFRDPCPIPYWPHMRKEYRPRRLAPPGIHFKGHSQGALVVMATNTSDCYLWHPPSSYQSLTPWNYPNIRFKLRAPSSKDTSHSQIMVVTGSSSPAFAVHVSRWTEETGCVREWSFKDCNMNEPYDPSKKMQLSNAIGFEGKYYALSLQGSVVVIECVDSSSGFSITAVGGNRAVPRKVSKQFREYMFECDGEILLVFLVSRKSIDAVDGVEVYRLDVGQLLWVEMEGIGERALFLEDECCMGLINAREVGCRRNCVYFTHLGLEDWFVFDMEASHISPAEENLCNVE